MNQFTITSEDDQKINKWLKEVVYPPIVAQQRKNPDVAHLLFELDDGTVVPYEGAIGGGLTFMFTPTSLGIITQVKYKDQTLDLTDYDMW